jgi:hypothetical protein
LFQAASYSGSFASLTLPPLNAGLAWNTNGLSNGFISVVAAITPAFTALALDGDGTIRFNGTGAASQVNELFAATNLLLPVTWEWVASATANVSGVFQLSDLQATNFPQRFYRIQSP